MYVCVCVCVCVCVTLPVSCSTRQMPCWLTPNQRCSIFLHGITAIISIRTGTYTQTHSVVSYGSFEHTMRVKLHLQNIWIVFNNNCLVKWYNSSTKQPFATTKVYMHVSHNTLTVTSKNTPWCVTSRWQASMSSLMHSCVEAPVSSRWARSTSPAMPFEEWYFSGRNILALNRITSKLFWGTHTYYDNHV